MGCRLLPAGERGARVGVRPVSSERARGGSRTRSKPGAPWADLHSGKPSTAELGNLALTLSVADLRPVRRELEVRALLGNVAAAAGGGVEARHRVRGGRWGVGAAAAVA